MKKQKTVIALVCGAAVGVAVAAEPSANVMEARGLVKGFFNSLKAQLQAAMKSGGPVKAIQVCNVQAPAIALHMSQESGWQLARTSLKLRSPANRPDAWEKGVLEAFEARKRAGENPEKMEFSEVVETDGVETFRYMKAIPTGEVCLKCHGDKVAPDVMAKLKQYYPDDQAIGFALGDIRGAFTLSRKL